MSHIKSKLCEICGKWIGIGWKEGMEDVYDWCSLRLCGICGNQEHDKYIAELMKEREESDKALDAELLRKFSE